MALDFYFAGRHEAIRQHEDYRFSLVESGSDRLPLLAHLHSRFYASTVLSPEDAGALVHELLALLDRNEHAYKGLSVLVLRLARFFSAAWRDGASIRCEGD